MRRKAGGGCRVGAAGFDTSVLLEVESCPALIMPEYKY